MIISPKNTTNKKVKWLSSRKNQYWNRQQSMRGGHKRRVCIKIPSSPLKNGIGNVICAVDRTQGLDKYPSLSYIKYGKDMAKP